MRKLVGSSLVSVDGVHGDPGSWASAYFDAEAVETSLAKLQVSDAMLMGRNTYEYFAAAWSEPTGPYDQRLYDIRKYVFSSTLTSADWNNSTVVSGDAVAAVGELKNQDGGDLMIYGYGQLSQTLLEHDLVDELSFWINPVVLGSGTPLFRPGGRRALRLTSSEVRSNGVVCLSYSPA
jgi:dihydrofolate reductase